MFEQKRVSLQKDVQNQSLMASIKPVIRKRQNAKGQCPIVIRITKNRKSSEIFTGQYIDPKDWDSVKGRAKKSHPNSTRLNNFLLKKLAEANDKLLELEGNQDGATAQTISHNIKRNGKSSSFFDLAEIYLAQLDEKGQYTRYSSEKPRVGHFRRFLKNRDVSFQEITPVLLKQFQAYLSDKRGNSDRTIANSLVVIRTIFNLGIREGMVDRKYYPFGRGGVIIRFPQSVKIGLSPEEVAELENIDLEIQPEWHARNVWLLSFYFAGMRISDVLRLKWSDFKDGRLHYQMSKNSKVLSLRIPEKAQKILALYEVEKNGKEDLVFPELKSADLSNPRDIRRKISTGNKKLNKYLVRVAEKIGLDKPLTLHIARHTFGNISGDRIPIQILQKLYRHSDITTTINYQKNFTFKEADDALEAVLSSKFK